MTCEVFPAYLTTSQHLNLKGHFQEFMKTLKHMRNADFDTTLWELQRQSENGFYTKLKRL